MSEAAAFPPIDFDDFHKSELPKRLAAGNGALASRDPQPLRPIAFSLPEGGAYTYVPREGGVDVVPGEAEAHTVVELTHDYWQGVVRDLDTAPGLIYAGRARCRRGDLMDFVRWEPRLRAMFHGREIFDPETADLRALDGTPLDPHQTFQLDDDPEEMAHFLRTAGYLKVREVFSAEEVARFLEHATRLREEAIEGDKQSWWGKNADGEAVLCRVINAGKIDELRNVHCDPRVAGLVELTDVELVGRDGATVLWKNPDMREGLSDIPWHRDCGMGGHAINCPVLICTINLTHGTPESGELRALPGSWQGSYPFFEATDPRAPVGVGLGGAPGDLSLHYGDLMHASPPPAGPAPQRISLLCAFAPKGAHHHRDEGHYNDVLLSRDDGQVEHLSKVAERQRPD